METTPTDYVPLPPVPGRTATPTDYLPPTVASILTFTPIPTPTNWICSSYRSEQLQSANIPGQVTIDTPQQGTSDILSGQNVQVVGTHTRIPKGNYLWVFVYVPIAGWQGRYYPQTRDALQGWQPEPTTGEDGRWALNISFGASNECYEVIVMLAEAKASQAIADQLKAWADLNNYMGYELGSSETAVPPDGPGFPNGLIEKVSIEVRTR